MPTGTNAFYCLQVVRDGNRFKPDPQSTLGISDLLEYSHLKEVLEESYQSRDAIVEINGIATRTRVFEPSSPDDCAYALVDSSGKPTSPPTLSHLIGDVIRAYFAALRRHLSFSDSFPPSHKSYLLTEYIEPQFTVLEGRSEHLIKFSWKEARGLNRAFIQGEPGIGKTTFLRKWALDEANKLGTEDSSRFPIYVQLRDLTDASTMWEVALKSILELNQEVEAEEVLESGRVVLLLDGLDELSPPSRRSLIKQVADLVNEWPTLGCLITSRTSTPPPSLPGFTRIQIERLDKPRQDEWIRRRIRRVGQAAESDLITMFRSSEPIAALSGNPLLLSIAAAVVERTGFAPTKPSSLVARYIDGLVEDWDEAKGVIRWSPTPLSKQKKVEILCRTAFQACRSNRPSFMKEDFLNWEQNWSDQETSSRALSALWEHSGIVQPLSAELSTWRFSHSVIADVLAARYLIERPDNLFVSAAKELDQERLRSIWRHACDLTQDATPLIKFMINNEDMMRAERAQLIAQTLLDDVTVPRNVVRECSAFVTEVVASYASKLSLIRAESDDDHWLMEAQWIPARVSDHNELTLLSSLLRTLTSGLSIENRATLADALRHSGGLIGSSIADQTQRGGAVSEHLYLESGRIVLSREKILREEPYLASIEEELPRGPKARPRVGKLGRERAPVAQTLRSTDDQTEPTTGKSPPTGKLGHDNLTHAERLQRFRKVVRETWRSDVGTAKVALTEFYDRELRRLPESHFAAMIARLEGQVASIPLVRRPLSLDRYLKVVIEARDQDVGNLFSGE